MTLKEAIKQADSMRHNTVGDEQKAAWLTELDGQIAEMMGKDVPKNTFPEDRILLMPEPHDGIYVLYLAAKIDYFHLEMDLYANDIAVYNAAVDEARAWYRRNNRPEPSGNWRGL